jgi:hypothetical protein
MLRSQAVEVERRVLDVQDDRPFSLQKKDVVRVTPGEFPGLKPRCETVRLGNGRQEICRACSGSGTAHLVSFS